MSLYTAVVRENRLDNIGRIAIICDKEKITYEELYSRVDRLANELVKCGVKKNSKVLLVNDSPIFFTVSLLALLSVNAIPIPLYASMGYEKVKDLINKYEINFVLRLVNSKQSWIKSDKDYTIKSMESVLCSFSDYIDPELDDVELIMFTSGTTSIPKAIMLTQKNIQSNIMAISHYLKLVCDDKILHVKDLSHSSSVIGELLVGLYNGCTIVFTTQLLLTHNIVNLIANEGITIFFAVPTLLNNIMNYKKLNIELLDKVRIVNFYGAPMHEENIAGLCSVFRNANIIYSYGQTEASPRVTYIEKDYLRLKRKSSGKPILGVKVYIMDEFGNRKLPNEKGEIVVEGPNVMKGYYKDLNRTNKTIINGKLHTNDVGYLDEDGYLYVTGRKDNMLITAGKNVYPEEIEGVLTSYKDVVDALVVGNNRKDGTVILSAYITVSGEIDKNSLFRFCREYLESYKIPDEIEIVSELEKTPSGKIIRKVPQS